MSYKPIDTQRDEFRKYLENAGLTEMLTKAFTQLLDSADRPKDPVEFLRKNIGASCQDHVEIQHLNEKIDKYRLRIDELEKQLEEAKIQMKNGSIDQNEIVNISVNDIKTEIKQEIDIKIETETENEEKNSDDTNDDVADTSTVEVVNTSITVPVAADVKEKDNENDGKSTESATVELDKEAVIVEEATVNDTKS